MAKIHDDVSSEMQMRYLSEDIYDSLGRLLLAKGMPLTSSAVEILSKRNIVLGKPDARVSKQGNAKDTDQYLVKHVQVLDEYAKFIAENTRVKPDYVQFGKRLTETALVNIHKQHPLLNIHLATLYTYMNPIHAHAIRVTFLAAMTAAEYGHLEVNLREIVLGSLFHDIGRLMAPSFINKTNTLSPNELQMVKQHSLIGSCFLENIGLAEGVWKAAGQHHESYNGGGYPQSISGPDIHINAQIVRLADVFDALVSLKAYQNPAGIQKAIAIIRQRQNMDFNPDVVEAFSRTFLEEDSLGNRSQA